MSYLNKLRNRLETSSLAQNEAGLSTVEYVIILVLIAAVAIGTWRSFGEQVQSGLNNAKKEFNTNVTNAKMSSEQ